jgi:hypothetical protein
MRDNVYNKNKIFHKLFKPQQNCGFEQELNCRANDNKFLQKVSKTENSQL